MPTLQDFSELLDESQWWPPGQMVAWQRQQLQFLLNHARATTPFYRFRLNSVFRGDGSIDWDRWQEIPIVKRADVFEHFDTIASKVPPTQHGPFQDVESSGSTGHPVKVRTTRWLIQTSAACNWRAHKWAGIDWSKTIVVTTAENSNLSVGDNTGRWGPRWLESAQNGRRIYSHYRTPFPDRLRLMRENDASYHSTSAPSAGRLVEEAHSTNNRVRLDTLLIRGGAVSETLRYDIRETFGADVLELYSSKECGAIAVRCPFGHGYHVNAETVLLEVVDDDGRPVAPGQAGRAVITPFASTAFPLIRYDQGDIVVAGTRCECGRSLPHLASISGREVNFLRHPDGRKSDQVLTQEYRDLIGAGLVQIAQIGPTNFEIRYTPRDWGVARDEAKFTEKFRKLVFEDAQVTFLEMSEIPLSPAGKFLSAVVEWREDNAAG